MSRIAELFGDLLEETERLPPKNVYRVSLVSVVNDQFDQIFDSRTIVATGADDLTAQYLGLLQIEMPGCVENLSSMYDLAIKTEVAKDAVYCDPSSNYYH